LIAILVPAVTLNNATKHPGLGEAAARENPSPLKKPAQGRFFIFSDTVLHQAGSGTTPVTITAMLTATAAAENHTLSFTLQ
jgi:hypothetical protein